MIGKIECHLDIEVAEPAEVVEPEAAAEADAPAEIHAVAEEAKSADPEPKAAPEPRAAPEYDDGQPVAREVSLEHGLTLDAAARAISAAPGGDAAVLEVDARDLSSFCGFEDPGHSEMVDAQLARAFHIQVHICGEEDNILPLVNWDPKVLPLNCTIGYETPKRLALRKCDRKQCKC